MSEKKVGKRLLTWVLVLVMTLSLLPLNVLADEIPETDGGAAATDDKLHFTKEATLDPQTGEITVRMEAWATGKVTTNTSTEALDIALVLDVSGSMKENFTQEENKYDPVYDLNNNETYYVKDALGWYHEVTWCADCGKWTRGCMGISGMHISLGKYEAKTNADDSSSDHEQLYKYSYTPGQNKLDALKGAVNSFIDNVATKSPSSRISIVKFAGNTSSEVGNDMYFFGNYNCTQIVKKLTAVTTSGAAELKAAVNALNYGGATSADYGMEKAQEALSEADTSHKKVVVLFTDGEPNHQNGFDYSVAAATINTARTMKTDTTIYTIGVFREPDNNVDTYMSSTSSNYPSASAATQITPPYWTVTDGGYDLGDYYKKVYNANDLLKAFETISSEVTPGTALDSTAVLTDVIAPNCSLVVPAGTSGITARTVDKTATGWSESGTDLTSGVTVNNGTVQVTGFDYSANCVTTTLKPNTNDYGKKLVVEFKVQNNNYGGTQPTNSDAFISDGNNGRVKTADEPCPKVSAPVKLPNPTENYTVSKVYDGDGYDIKANIAGLVAGLVPVDGTNNKYIDLSYEIKDSNGTAVGTYKIPAGQATGTWADNSDIKTPANVGDYTYTVTVTGTDKEKEANFDSKDYTAKFSITDSTSTVTLTFDAKGGSWKELSNGSAYTLNESKDKATQKVAANSKPAVVSPNPVKPGFTFDGWYLGNDRLYVDFVPIDNSDMTLDAHWKPAATKTYTVVYTDGLTANKAFDDQSTGNLSLGVKTPEFNGTPTRSGYVFTGWTPTVAPRVEAPKDGSTVITYTATWEVDNWNSNDNRETGGDGIPDKYQALVKFLPGDLNGEVGGKTTQVITMPKTGVEYASAVKLGNVEGFEVATATPKIDFEFNVWTMNEVTDENKDEAKTAVTPEDMTVTAGSKTTFFAHFKAIPTTYTVTYTDGVDGKAFKNQQYSAKYDEMTPAFVGTPTREGYEFLGWDPAVAKTVAGDATYTAKWEAKSYTVTYNSNGGTVVKPETVTYGNKATKPTNPTLSGYTFAGWYTDNEKFFNKYDFNTLVTGNIILYAKWTRNYTPRPYTPPTVVIPDDDALGLNTTDHFAYIVGYGNGEVRPQNNITRAEVATIFFRLLTDDVRDENLTKTNRYSDVAATSWYNTAVSTLSSMGIITGYPDGTFRPNAAITRAEFAAIAARFDNDGDKTAAKFSDIATHWAKDEISIAYNNGWITGYPDGTFGPQRDITRAETMTLVNRVLNRQPETEDDLLPNMTVWTDNANPKAWYYLAVQEATNSHYYKFKTNSKYEKWTELRETRDWTQLEK